MKRIAVIFTLVVVFAISARGQGFQNLDFESAYDLPANPPVPDGVDVATTNALPGWTAFGGDSALLSINYVSNDFSGVATLVEVEGGSLALAGDFSVGLYLNSSISQTGLVPADAESLDFEAKGPGPGYSLAGTDLSVTLDGQNLSFSPLSQGSDYIVYGANIPSEMDGQLEALIFSCEGVGSGNVLLDDIEFLPTSVPEPGEGALIGVAAVLFGVLRWRRGRRRGYTGR